VLHSQFAPERFIYTGNGGRTS